MALLSLLPYGLMQVHAAVTHGFWYARSAEFLQQPLMQTLVWMRMPGDVIFAIGAGMLALFVAKLYIGKAKPDRAAGLGGSRGDRGSLKHRADRAAGACGRPPSFEERKPADECLSQRNLRETVLSNAVAPRRIDGRC